MPYTARNLSSGGGGSSGEGAARMMGEFFMGLAARKQKQQELAAQLQEMDYGAQQGDQGGGFDPTGDGTTGAAEGSADAADEGPLPGGEALGKKAVMMRKLLSHDQPEFKSHYDALDVDQLSGILRARELKSTMDEHAAKMADYRAQAVERLQRAADDVTIGKAVNRFAQAPGVPMDYGAVAAPSNGEGAIQDEDLAGPVGLSRPASTQERFMYALGTPGLAGRHVPKLIESLTKYSQMLENPDNQKATVDTFDLPGGSKGANLRGSKDLKILPMVGDEEGAGGSPQTRTLSNGAVQAWNGRAWMNVPAPKEPAAVKVPESFHKTMDEVTGDITSAQATMADEGADKDKKARAARMLSAAQARGKATVDRYHGTGVLSDEARASAYSELGLGAGSPESKVQSPKSGTGAATGRVMVVDQAGKKFWLPAGQVSEAVKKGYKVVK